MIKKYSLTKTLIQAKWVKPGLIECSDGTFLKSSRVDPISSGILEYGLEGPASEAFYQRLADLLSRLPNFFEGQLIIVRSPAPNDSLQTQILCFERTQKEEGYSHLRSLLGELKMTPEPLSELDWNSFLATIFGPGAIGNRLPDVVWEKEALRSGDRFVRALSLTELPQVTWKGCFQGIFESPNPFALSFRFQIPDRKKVKRQLETKRRVSHALSISTSLELRNIESNSVLHSSEETLERILVNKECLFEISLALIVSGTNEQSRDLAQNFERIASGIGNAGLYTEQLGSLPVITSHIPGARPMSIRTLPILSENLAQILPLLHDFSRSNDWSSLSLRSRTSETSHLNLFSSGNLNFNSFICGASGSGKSFLMNAILSAALRDDPGTRLCIFDIGGSYRRIVDAHGGNSQQLTAKSAKHLIASFLQMNPINDRVFYREFIESLCGSGAHITHSHRVAIDELLRQNEGRILQINEIVKMALQMRERFYLDIAHWLKPHLNLSEFVASAPADSLVRPQMTAFDFKELADDPVLQRTTILLLSEWLWTDLMNGKHARTLIVFDEVWRFFAQSKSFLEEMYRTLRKYKAGIVSITQNLADYGDEAFAKMIFTNSFTKIFLQNGASADFMKGTFDLSDSDIARALSVTSMKPHYSEFFALSPAISQIFRLYPSKEFYDLANTENVSFMKGV